MAALANGRPPWPAAVAVSGGGDSMALMILLARWAKAQKLLLPTVLTIDHGLRPGSAAMARAAVRAARAHGLRAHVLVWAESKPEADIENAARLARYRLLGKWCAAHKMAALYLAHNLEDQAETFLLRLARGSGVDGLSAMRTIAPFPIPGFPGLVLVRPLLGFTRAELRDLLKAEGIAWAEDPMNEDPRFARSRIRALGPAMAEAGLSAGRIAGAAGHLARARDTLDSLSNALIRRYSHVEGGQLLLNGRAFADAPPELVLRSLSSLLMRVSGQQYRPRFQSLERLVEAIRARSLGGGRTLHGCRIGLAPKRLAFFGAQTLLIRPETPRRPPRAAKPPGKRRKSRSSPATAR